MIPQSPIVLRKAMKASHFCKKYVLQINYEKTKGMHLAKSF